MPIVFFKPSNLKKMKKLYQKFKSTWLILLSMFIFAPGFAQETAQLPQQVSFEGFNGVNISEINAGWNEAAGIPTSVSIGGSNWYASDALYSTKNAAISLDNYNKHSWFISPVFEANVNTIVKFKAAISLLYKEPMLSSLGGDDKFAVMVAGEQDASFEPLMEFTTMSENKLTLDFQEFEIDLSAYKDQTIKIGFYATDGNIKDGMCSVHLDDIVIENKETIDPMLMSIINPTKNTVANSTCPFLVEIKNNGSTEMSNIPVKGIVRGSATENFFKICEKTLQPGETDTLTLGEFNYTNEGDYTFEAKIDYNDDKALYNNTVSNNLLFNGLKDEVIPVLTFSDILLDINYKGWKEARGEKEFLVYPFDSDWRISDYDYERCGRVYFTEIYTHDWLISPNFTVKENTKIAFDLAIRYLDDVTAMGSDDYFSVVVSDDNMNTWNEVGRIDKNTNPSSEWTNYSFDLKDYKDKNVVVAVCANTGLANDPEYYYAYIDNVEIREFRDNDLAINKIVSPGILPEYGTEHTISVEIENLGLNDASNFKLTYAIDENVLSMETFTETLTPGNKVIYNFAVPADLSQCSGKNLKIEVVFNDDDNNDNNTLEKTLKTNYIDLSKSVYINDFEASDCIDSWTILNANQDEKEWDITNDSRRVYLGENAVSYKSNGSLVTSDDWLITPAIKMLPGTYSVSFYYSNYAGALPEKLRLMFGNKPEKNSMLTEIIDMGELTNNEFYQTKQEITVVEEGFYYIGWHAYGDPDQYGVSIDNVEIERVKSTDLKASLIMVPHTDINESGQLNNINDFIFAVDNVGQTTIEAFKAFMSIDNGEAKEVSFTQSINAGNSCKTTFSTDFDLNPYQTYNIKFWVSTENDGSAYNDTLILNNYYLAEFNSSFETDDFMGGWKAENIKGVEQTFKLVKSNMHAHIGDFSYKLKTDNYNQTENDDWLISEGLYFEKDKCYELSFWYNPYISEDSLIIAIGKEQSAAAMNIELFNYGKVGAKDNDQYFKSTLRLSVSESGRYYIGWHVFGDLQLMTRYCFYIDDVSVTEVSNFEPIVDFEYKVLDKEISFTSQCERTENVSWNFGDEITSTEWNPFHTYAENGTYNVILKAQNGCGISQIEKSIEMNCPVNTAFTYTSDGDTYQFTSEVTENDFIVWDFGDDEYSFEANPTHKYSKEGDYTVSLKVINKCGEDILSKNITYEVSTGMNDLTEKVNINIYPSPVTTILYIDGIDNNTLTNIRIYSTNGNLAQTFSYRNNFEGSVDLSMLNTGIYFIEFVQNNQEHTVKKFIKK